MSVNVSKEPKKTFILPFATPVENRRKDFTKNMETAAILYLAEANRKKGEHPRLKKTEEKLVFITQVCYPIWLIPHNKATLIFDGLGLASHASSFDVTPDVKVFNKDVQRNQKTTESYTATLTRNIDYFRTSQAKEETKIEGLITTPDLKKDLKTLLSLKKKTKKQSRNSVFLKPITRIHEIRSQIKQLSALEKKNDRDIKNINASMKLLNTATARRVKAIKDEIEKIRKTHRKQIKKTKLKMTKSLQQVNNQYNQKIARTSKKYKKRLLQLNKKQTRLKKKAKSLRKEAKQIETKIKSSKPPQRKRYERRWIMNLGRTKKKLQTLRKQTKVNSKRIRMVENAQKRELAKQRRACCKRIQSINRKYRDRQGSREAEIIMKRQEIATVEEVTRIITKSMQSVLQKKKLFNAEFEKIFIPQTKKAVRMVYLQFYLARYEKGDKRRYTIYPPSTIEDMGILTKMKGALGATKVKNLIKPRSEAMAAFLNQLLTLFEKKPMLEKDVTEASIQKSILLLKRHRIGISKGLKQLENENWISKKERQVFSKILYTYASATNRQLNTILIPEQNYLQCLPA